MNILVLGSGGREHALAWKLAQSALIADLAGRLYAAPGNPGIGEVAQCVALDVLDHAAVIAFCESHGIGLVVVGPEAPLVDGIADSLRGAGIAVFGPSAAAAQLEGSKGFTKDLCTRAGIPTAGYERVATEDQALAALARFGAPVVVKADGLAAGKGVTVAMTMAEAEEAVRDIFTGRFGEAGAEAVIEEFLEGEEVSFFAITDGATIVPFGSAQDHKRVGEGDSGANTGGMGAYSPARVLTALLEGEVIERIVAPTVRDLADQGMPYSGVLFAGLMLTREGPKLIEYNCRFGDPECQVLAMRLESDLGELLLACAENRLAANRTAAVFRRNGAHRGACGRGLSGYAEAGRAHRRHRRGRGDRRESIPRRHFALARRRSHRQRRTRAERHGVRRKRSRSAGARLCGGRCDRFPRGLLPARHRLSGSGARSRLD